MNQNFICQHYCLLPINQCYCYYHSKEICCSCSIPIEEIFTWIVIYLLIVFFYNTIRLCIIIVFILSIICWIYKQTEIPRLLTEFYQKQMNSKSSSNEQMSDNDNQQLNTPPVNENDQDQDSLLKQSLSNSNLDTDSTSNNDFIKADNCDETIKISKRSLNEKKLLHQSTTKKLLIDNTQDQDEFNNSTTIKQIEQRIIDFETSVDPSVPDRLILTGTVEQTTDIHQTIESLHADILQIKTNSNNRSNLSLEEQHILKLATENLIQIIISNRTDQKQESSPSIFDDNHRQSENTDKKSKQSSKSEIILNETPLQQPKCVTVQPSFAVNSLMPRVPTKSTVTAMDENDGQDEKSYDDYTNTCGPLITTNEQFENIFKENKRKSENTLLLKDSIFYNNDQPDWAYYSSKPDLFPDTIQSDLPIVQSEEQHLSLKHALLSHLHRRPATFHSSSLNASDYMKSYKSNFTSEEQRMAQQLLDDKAPIDSIYNKTLNHVKQPIFRVRKSRIIMSVDGIQQQKDADDNHLNTSGNTVVHDRSREINHARSQPTVNTYPHTKMTNSSIISLFQSLDSALQDGELLIHHDKSIYQDSSANEDSLSKMSNSLYSVTSESILI